MNWSLQTAARTLWQEARNQPLEGQRAVAHVISNRLKDGRWGDTLGEVCLWHAGFSGWFSPRIHDGVIVHDPNFAPSCRIGDDDLVLGDFGTLIEAALNGDSDLTGGATHYYAKSIAPPTWVFGATFCGQFGSQLFYKNVR